MARYGMLINTKKCVGCYACRVACQMINGLDSDKAFIHYEELETGTYPSVYAENVPVQCMHCENAPCASVCPTHATYTTDSGVVLVEEEKCIGCKYCMMACPYGVRDWNKASQTVEKCTLCGHLTANGELPACVKSCSAGARFYGDLDDPNSDVSQELAKYDAADIHELPNVGNNPCTKYIMTSMHGEWMEGAE